MLPAVLTDALASESVIRPDGTATALRSNVSLDEAQRLYDVVRVLQPETTMEIGLAQGISTLAIAQAHHDNDRGLHHVIDPFQHSRYEAVGLKNLERAGLDDRVRFYEAFCEEVVPALPQVGFAFVDGSHRFDHAMVDFVLIDKRLEVGGLIGFHDLWMPALQQLLRYILTNRRYRVHEEVPPRGPFWPDPPRDKKELRRLARRVPHAEGIFRGEFLHPIRDLGIRQNMIFIEKTGDDDRVWDFHRQF